MSTDAAMHLAVFHEGPGEEFEAYVEQVRFRGWSNISLWPSIKSTFWLELPIWLLAAVCLAWPVTSLLVRRRRRGRGFEVEAKAAGDPAADPPDAAGGQG